MKELIVLGLIVLLLLGCAAGIDFAACNAKADAMGKACRYNVFSGCVIESDPGQWIPLENYRYFGED